MLGKNQGKNMGNLRRLKKLDAGNLAHKSDTSHRLESITTESQTTIPPKVGSDLSTIRLADAVEPYKIDVVLRCKSRFSHLSPLTRLLSVFSSPCLHSTWSHSVSSIAKQALYPLSSCISFDKKEETWIEPLAFDAAYLNAVIFTTLGYFETLRHCDQSTVSQRTLPHFLRTIQLLRRRLLLESDRALTIPTISTILALAAYAHFVGDSKSAGYHLGGLHKIVNLRGGVAAFNLNAKLLVEILR